MKLAILCVAVGLFLPCAAKAQEFVTSQRLPDSPSAHKFWTLENKVNFSIYSGELAADAITTQMGLSQGMRETNPLARPLVTRGAAGQAVASGLGLGAGVGLTYLLHRTQGGTDCHTFDDCRRRCGRGPQYRRPPLGNKLTASQKDCAGPRLRPARNPSMQPATRE